VNQLLFQCLKTVKIFCCLGPEEYPTLLHFAARNGLEKLAWQLLECPGGVYACEIRNACELTPAEMAEAAGHNKLANALRGYMVTISSHYIAIHLYAVYAVFNTHAVSTSELMNLTL
jgi:hypothetical protein